MVSSGRWNVKEGCILKIEKNGPKVKTNTDKLCSTNYLRWLERLNTVYNYRIRNVTGLS